MASMVSRGRGRRTINEINMVPFIDVMLVLLIIFMVTAPMLSPSLVDLPSIGKAAKQPDRIIEVEISKSNQLKIIINRKKSTTDLKSISSVIQKEQIAQPNSAVVISADKSIKYEEVIKLMDTLQRAGVSRLGLSVQLKP